MLTVPILNMSRCPAQPSGARTFRNCFLNSTMYKPYRLFASFLKTMGISLGPNLRDPGAQTQSCNLLTSLTQDQNSQPILPTPLVGLPCWHLNIFALPITGRHWNVVTSMLSGLSPCASAMKVHLTLQNRGSSSLIACPRRGFPGETCRVRDPITFIYTPRRSIYQASENDPMSAA